MTQKDVPYYKNLIRETKFGAEGTEYNSETPVRTACIRTVYFPNIIRRDTDLRGYRPALNRAITDYRSTQPQYGIL
jgi:hypothetical protein